VVSEHGYLEEILEGHCPPRLEGQKEALFQAQKTGKLLGTMLTKGG